MSHVHKFRKSFALLAVVITSVVAAAGSAFSEDKQKVKGKHFLWTVKSKSATVYLLGSVHVGKKDLYPLPDVIENAFKKADVLVLEVPLDQQTQIEAGTKMLAIARYTGGDSLDKSLPKAVKAKLDAHLKKRNVPVAALNQFKPWMVSLILTLQELDKDGFKPQYGIDQHFFKRADGKKPVVGLETVDDQVNMFKNMNAASQVTMLEQTLSEINGVGAMMAKTFKAWKTGDADKLDALMLKPMRKPKYKAVYNAMFTDRNRKMVKKIGEFLKSDKTYFVVVGSGHLVGEGGIVDLLRKQKLTVEQL